MPVDRINDLRAFRDFADARLSAEGVEPTLQEALALWEAENTRDERAETVKAIREALDDMRAGDVGTPWKQAVAELRGSV